ncbi:hypothetical protein GWK47_054654 [Chionoecetes opilio]|uniref:Uncharacterized protein n=1 Tax=Chionoecetes opilio TaxID=41210 RepID=A0A8J4XZM6_CHIOP|nr:hypothetical protein GWK47_054654 [Chionoecetes opilio]
MTSLLSDNQWCIHQSTNAMSRVTSLVPVAERWFVPQLSDLLSSPVRGNALLTRENEAVVTQRKVDRPCMTWQLRPRGKIRCKCKTTLLTSARTSCSDGSDIFAYGWQLIITHGPAYALSIQFQDALMSDVLMASLAVLFPQYVVEIYRSHRKDYLPLERPGQRCSKELRARKYYPKGLLPRSASKGDAQTVFSLATGPRLRVVGSTLNSLREMLNHLDALLTHLGTVRWPVSSHDRPCLSSVLIVPHAFAGSLLAPVSTFSWQSSRRTTTTTTNHHQLPTQQHTLSLLHRLLTPLLPRSLAHLLSACTVCGGDWVCVRGLGLLISYWALLQTVGNSSRPSSSFPLLWLSDESPPVALVTGRPRKPSEYSVRWLAGMALSSPNEGLDEETDAEATNHHALHLLQTTLVVERVYYCCLSSGASVSDDPLLRLFGVCAALWRLPGLFSSLVHRQYFRENPQSFLFFLLLLGGVFSLRPSPCWLVS